MRPSLLSQFILGIHFNLVYTRFMSDLICQIKVEVWSGFHWKKLQCVDIGEVETVGDAGDIIFSVPISSLHISIIYHNTLQDTSPPHLTL